MFYKMYDSPIGKITLISDGENLISLKINDLETIGEEKDDLEVFKKTIKWLDDYFNKKEPFEKIPLKFKGTEFQKEVWNILLKIPYGSTITYGEIARMIAKKRNIKRMSAQAIGNAVHNNKIPLIIPCHRVVGKNNLGGYAFGIKMKIKLLELEKISQI